MQNYIYKTFKSFFMNKKELNVDVRLNFSLQAYHEHENQRIRELIQKKAVELFLHLKII